MRKLINYYPALRAVDLQIERLKSDMEQMENKSAAMALESVTMDYLNSVRSAIIEAADQPIPPLSSNPDAVNIAHSMATNGSLTVAREHCRDGRPSIQISVKACAGFPTTLSVNVPAGDLATALDAIGYALVRRFPAMTKYETDAEE